MRIITDFYNTEKQANIQLKKYKKICRNPKVLKTPKGFYTVQVYEDKNRDMVYKALSHFLRLGLHCGVLEGHWENGYTVIGS